MQIFASDRLLLTMFLAVILLIIILISVYISLNTVKQPSLFTDEVFKRQIVLEHVMEQVEQSNHI